MANNFKARAKRVSQTHLVELVETHNLATSINRLQDAGAYDGNKWRRALYHALGLCHIGSGTLAKIREALELA